MRTRPDIVDRAKSSSHPLTPGRIYNGKITAVDSAGRVTVSVPELTSSYSKVTPLDTTTLNKYVVGDNVKCMFSNEFFTELIILGSSRIKTDVFASAATVESLETLFASLVSTVASLQMLNSTLQATVLQLSDRVTALEITS